MTDDLDHAVDLVINNASLQAHLRSVVSHLLEFKDQFLAVMEKIRELLSENEKVHKENADLMNENTSLGCEIGNQAWIVTYSECSSETVR